MWVGRQWWYFPGAALVKLPATVWFSMLAGAAVLACRRRWGDVGRAAGWVGGVLAAFLLLQPLNLGLRLALPVVALALLLAAPAARLVGALAGWRGRLHLCDGRRRPPSPPPRAAADLP